MKQQTLAQGVAGRPFPDAGRSLLYAFLVVAAVAIAAVPFVFHLSPYLLTIIMQTVAFAVAVLGMTVVLGYTGQINLAQAAFFAIGAYAMGIGTVLLGLGFWTSVLIGLAASALAGLIIGLTTLRLGGHYLAMITICFQVILTLVLINWASFTQGPDGIAGIERPTILGVDLSDDRYFLLFCIAVLYAVMFLVWWLPRTRIGRGMRAVRENELAAEVLGVHTLRIKVIAFTISAMLGGLGGIFYGVGFAYINPDNFNFNQSVVFLTMSLLGGAESVFGTVFGTVLLIILPEWLRFLKDIYLAVYGVAVILIMVFMPTGMWGLLRRLLDRYQKRIEPDPGTVQAFSLPDRKPGERPVMEITDLRKHFGGIKAVDGVSTEIRHGTIHALIGPNGSGKTTTLNMLSGIYDVSGGDIHFGGARITSLSPHRRAELGIGRTFQNIRLFPEMTAAENVMVGAQRQGNSGGMTLSVLRECALSALEFVGMLPHAYVTVKNLPYGHQRLVEIARALAASPTLLLLDEPAAGLNQTEKRNLGSLLKRLKKLGITILLIEHDIGLIEQVSDVITVLNFGKKIAEGEPGTVLQHPDVIAAYLGSETHATA